MTNTTAASERLRTVVDRFLVAFGPELGGLLAFDEAEAMVPDEKTRTALRERSQPVAGEAAAIWRAFAGFCSDELLCEPETALTAFYPEVLPRLVDLEEVEIDPARVTEFRNYFQAVLRGEAVD